MGSDSNSNIKCTVHIGKKKTGFIYVEKHTIASAIVSEICKALSLDESFKSRQLVFLPTTTFPGSKLRNDDIAFVVAKTLKIPLQEVILSLFEDPALVHVKTRKGDQKSVLIDYSSPLDNFTLILCNVFKLEQNQLVYKINFLSRAQWVHSGTSFEDNQFEIDSAFLNIYEASSLCKVFSSDIKPNFHIQYRGWLYYSKDETRRDRKKAYFVLSDFFLAKYKSTSQGTPDVILSLDGYYLSFNNQTHMIRLENIITGKIYWLSSQDNNEILEWMNWIHKRCANSGSSHVFGRSLKELLISEGVYQKSNIPRLLNEIVLHLNNHLEENGLFRINGYEGDVKELKMFYDLREDVQLDGVSPHVAADIIKIWLQELPEPLIPESLYPEFILAIKEKNDIHIKKSRIYELVLQMPPENVSVLNFLCGFFNRLTFHKNFNPLEVTQICIVFGALIFKYPQLQEEEKKTEYTNYISEICQILILNRSLLEDANTKHATSSEKPSDLSDEQVQIPKRLSKKPKEKSMSDIPSNPTIPNKEIITSSRSMSIIDNIPPISPRDTNFHRHSTSFAPLNTPNDEFKELKQTVQQLGKTLNEYIKAHNLLTTRTKELEQKLEHSELNNLSLQQRIQELEERVLQ